MAVDLLCSSACIQPHTLLLRIAGTVVAKPPRRAVAVTRLAIVVPSVSTRTGPTTCTTVPQGYKVRGLPPQP